MYKIKIAENAAKFIRGRTQKVQRQLLAKIKKLSQEPYHQNSVKLQGTNDLYRIVSGIIYTVKHKEVTVLVLRIAHRKEVYQNLPEA